MIGKEYGVKITFMDGTTREFWGSKEWTTTDGGDLDVATATFARGAWRSAEEITRELAPPGALSHPGDQAEAEEKAAAVRTVAELRAEIAHLKKS